MGGFWEDRKPRCAWANPKNPAYIAYHDNEWAVTWQADLAARLGKLSGHVSKYKKRLLQRRNGINHLNIVDFAANNEDF